MDAELLIQQIFAANTVWRVRPSAISAPARNGFPNFRSHPWDEAGMIAHPRCKSRTVIKIQRHGTTIRKVVYRLSHRFATLLKRGIRCRTGRAYDNVCTRLICQLLDSLPDRSGGAHFCENFVGWHILSFDLKPGRRPRHKAADSSARWERDTNVQPAICSGLISAPSYK